MTGVWSGVMTATAVEPNYWKRRVAAEQADIAPAKPARTRADVLEDVLYALALTVLWTIGTLLMAWKTVPGGLEALPTFLILEGMITTYTIAAWVKTR